MRLSSTNADVFSSRSSAVRSVSRANHFLAYSTIRFSSTGTIEPGVARALFPTNVGSTARLPYRQQYVVSPDGQSFVMNSAVSEGTASPITVILNWKPKGGK